jgi:succinate-acetate transporter protein
MARSETVGPTRVVTPATPVIPPVADPAPLGLAAFALTTFLLSAQNAGLTDGPDAWLGFALAYGGLIQLLAGMWELRNRNVFGSTAFSTYGGFWLGLGLWFLLVAPGAASEAATFSALGWILLAFAIFNSYMLLWSTQVNISVFLVFLTLEATEIVLCIGFFSGSTTLVKAGGWIGIATAAVAWYASAAGVINGMKERRVLPVGSPIGASSARTGRTPARVDRTAA